MIRIIIADDHELIRVGVEAIATKDEHFTVIGEASSIGDLNALLETSLPDILILDISLEHRRSGLEFLSLHQELLKKMKVLILSMSENLSLVDEAISLGVLGYLTKAETTNNLLAAIQTVANGDLYLSPRISRLLLEATRDTSKSTVSPVSHLTKRESLIFHLLGQGLVTKEIAKHLKISRSTVSTHVENIKFKLNVSGIQGLTKKAIEWENTQTE